MIVYDSDTDRLLAAHLDAAAGIKDTLILALVIVVVIALTVLVSFHQAYTESQFGAAMACEEAGRGYEKQMMGAERCYVQVGDGHWREVRKVR